MKILLPIADCRLPINSGSVGARPSSIENRKSKIENAFTMVEIAISLAIIGIALVAIIGVLPIGMRMQRDNREQTVINQDATVFMEAIRSGARGMDDLTNYVFMITNTYAGDPNYSRAYSNFTGGAQIIGLLSTPEFVDGNDVSATPANYVYSNRMVAFVYSMSGPAVEKPPQSNGSLIRQSSFSYGLICENLPVPMDTNAASSPYGMELAANLHELRLTFLWPLLPDSQPPRVHYGTGHQTYRTMVAGQIIQTNINSRLMYFFQPQSFVNNTTAP
jgi:type II secretory pathway pseudopilin PulG